VLLLVAAGCQPAGRYPEAPPGRPASGEALRPAPAPHYGWLAPRLSADIPIRFVDAASRPEEWKALPDFWNHRWGGVGGQRTAHLGLPQLGPLGPLASLRLAAEQEAILIKVPRGLPDPTPHIPAVNLPTLGKWQLGKKLFFDRELLPGANVERTYGCVSCHSPSSGYTLPRPHAPYGKMNIPSLINCVYNRHQFWDGRADRLEEVLQRTLEDEHLTPPRPDEDDPEGRAPEVRHRWGGVVRRLRGQAAYVRDFERVFGTDPTQDNLVKALATYLRTILSGNAVYDRAEAARAARTGETLSAGDFQAALDADELKSLTGDRMTADQAGRELLRGYALFHGRGRCGVCHPGTLFTDHDFHNLGVRESDSYLNPPGSEKGRFARLPPGLKARRYIGAFKTPTLRALPRTAPYMHDGSFATLAEVMSYFNGAMRADINRYLDPLLLDGEGEARHPALTVEEMRALLMFLRSLDGGPVPPVVAEP
jgi:cytochrome c peroxidase